VTSTVGVSHWDYILKYTGTCDNFRTDSCAWEASLQAKLPPPPTSQPGPAGFSALPQPW
jgi:hypothetical protein